MSDANLLVVEGSDDLHVLYSLFQYHNIPEYFRIEEKKGIENVLQFLTVQLKIQDDDSPLRRIGIVVDADTNIASRWASLQTILHSAGYSNLPHTISSSGIIIENIGMPIIGIWLMPNNTFPGVLEDFIRFLVPQNDMLWPRVEQVIKEIPTEERRFPEHRLSKVQIHTWLAWQEEPGKPMGQAITARYLDANAPHAQYLINWVRQLFTL